MQLYAYSFYIIVEQKWEVTEQGTKTFYFDKYHLNKVFLTNSMEKGTSKTIEKRFYWRWGREHLLKGKCRPLSEVMYNCFTNFTFGWSGSGKEIHYRHTSHLL